MAMSRRNLAADESTLADDDQTDIGWFRLSERGNGAFDDRVRRCSFVVAAVGCQNARLLACGCQIGRFTTELTIGNRDPVGSTGLGHASRASAAAKIAEMLASWADRPIMSVGSVAMKSISRWTIAALSCRVVHPWICDCRATRHGWYVASSAVAFTAHP